ncbi:MAG: hypothetical protein WCV50_03470 [Patescibacteria group bacterium]|jgi:hypothetical protein
MKKEIIIWQLIVLALGLFLVFSLNIYFRDKNEIDAESKRADCLINITEKNLNLSNVCADIVTYKL